MELKEIELYRSNFYKGHGFRLEISMTSDVSEYTVQLGMEGWVVPLALATSFKSLQDAWNKAVKILESEREDVCIECGAVPMNIKTDGFFVCSNCGCHYEE